METYPRYPVTSMAIAKTGNDAVLEMVEGGVFAALTVVLALLQQFLPLSPLIQLAVPLPTAILYLRRSRRSAFLSAFTATWLMLLFLGFISAISLGILTLVVGMAFGYTYRHNWSTVNRLLAVSVAMGISVAVNVVLIAILTFGSVAQIGKVMYQVIQPLVAMLPSVQKMFVKNYEAAGLSPALAASKAKALAASWRALMEGVLPSLMVFVAASYAFLTDTYMRWLMDRLKATYPHIERLGRLRLPLFFLWIYLIGVFIMQWTSQGTWYYGIAVNLMFLTGIMIAIQGVAVGAYYFRSEKRKVSRLTWFVIVVLGWSTSLFLYVGLADLALDLRGLRRAKS